jgi:hypothetical protein
VTSNAIAPAATIMASMPPNKPNEVDSGHHLLSVIAGKLTTIGSLRCGACFGALSRIFHVNNLLCTLANNRGDED